MKQLTFFIFLTFLTIGISAQSCPFCKIVRNKNKQFLIKESANAIAIRKDRPVMCGQNFLVIPKKHYVNLIEIEPATAGPLLAEMVQLVKSLAMNGKTGHFTITINNGVHSEKTMAQEMAEKDKDGLCTSTALELNTDIISTQSVAHMHMHVTSADTDWGFERNNS